MQVGGSDFAFSDNYYSSKGGTILGGKLNTTSDKLVFTHEPMDHSWSSGYDNVLDGVTIRTWDGSTLAGLNLNNGGTVRLANGHGLNGHYQLDNDARITFGDDKTFGSGSNFTFGAGGGALAVWDHRVVRLEDGVSITGPKATITGGDASRLVNTTVIGQTGAGSHWTLSTAITENQGDLNANDGAKLSLATNVTNHTSRTISATNGGYLRVRDSIISAHEIKLGNGGTIAFDNNVAIAADQLTLQGGGSTLNMPMAPGSSLIFANGMTVQGVLGSIGGELPGSPPNTQPRDFVNEASIFIQNNAALDGAASIDSTSFKNTGTVQLDPNAKLVLNANTLNTGVFQAALGSNITTGAGFVQTDCLSTTAPSTSLRATFWRFRVEPSRATEP